MLLAISFVNSSLKIIISIASDLSIFPLDLSVNSMLSQ